MGSPGLRQTLLKYVGEQMMVTVPSAFFVQRKHEQIVMLDMLQHCLPARGSCVSPVVSGDRVAQRGAHAVQDRGLEQKGPDVLRLAIEDLRGQVVHHVAIAASERVDKAGHVGVGSRRQSRYL